MVTPLPCYRLLLTSSILILLCQVITIPVYAQLRLKDSTVRKQLTALQSNARTAAARHFSDSLTKQKDSLFQLFTRPALQFTGGTVSYNFNYRSNIDTPYLQKDVVQHNVSGRLDVTVAGAIPVQVNYRLR